MGYLDDIRAQLEIHNVYCELRQCGSYLGGEQLVVYEPTHTHGKSASVMRTMDGTHIYLTLGDFDTLKQTRTMYEANRLLAKGASIIILEHFSQ